MADSKTGARTLISLKHLVVSGNKVLRKGKNCIIMGYVKDTGLK